MPIIGAEGSLSSQGYGQFARAGASPVYIEDVFSTWLYTGTSATQTITNGIDLSTKGGLVWLKPRDGAFNHVLTDTARGAPNFVSSNTSGAQVTVDTQALTAFNTTGFTLGTSSNVNYSPYLYTSWTFRKQPKFFDVVTFNSNASYGATFNHNLGSVPGCMIVKCTGGGDNWIVWHRSLTGGLASYVLYLNLTDAEYNQAVSVTATSTSITIPNFALGLPSTSYVAYLFAHNAGGFGLTGTDNVISCGSFTSDGSGNATVSLGYEPQWVMIKPTSQAGDWIMQDVMRNFTSSTSGTWLYANTGGAELSSSSMLRPTATGFVSEQNNLSTSTTYIYIAIRRGPMKTPTTGTSVFSPTASAGVSGTVVTTGFPVDLQMLALNGGWVSNTAFYDRPRGLRSNATGSPNPDTAPRFSTTSTNSESTAASNNLFNNTGYRISAGMAAPAGIWNFRRAPGFFDIVCYTGTIPLGGGTQTVTHNLGVAPELMIFKSRSPNGNWCVVASALGLSNGTYINSNGASAFQGWVSAVTASTFTSGGARTVVENGTTYVAYLFATLAGVSKVGTYTGTGALQTIDCGFTGGARFVLIKRADSTGDWYLYDSANGISSGNDPYFLLNSTGAQVTGTDYVGTTGVGFQVTASAPAGLNASGGTYLFFAIA